MLCLTDKCERIRDLATQFFTKLSERANNPVYNLLGDIIAHLSCERAAAVPSPTPAPPDATEAAAEEMMSTQASSVSLSASASAGIEATALLDVKVLVDGRQLGTKEFETTMEFMLSFVKKDK